jgi:transposase InsO family protein
MAHLVPTNETVTAVGIAKLYLDNIFCLHGLPKEWTTDRGPQFASQVMKEIHKMLGIKTSISTAYHPQSNGQTERVNQEIEAYCQELLVSCPLKQKRVVSDPSSSQFTGSSTLTTAVRNAVTLWGCFTYMGWV